jgi:hypothetical protein
VITRNPAAGLRIGRSEATAASAGADDRRALSTDELARPKTSERRTVPLAAGLARELRTHRKMSEWSRDIDFVFASGQGGRCMRPTTDVASSSLPAKRPAFRGQLATTSSAAPVLRSAFARERTVALV